MDSSAPPSPGEYIQTYLDKKGKKPRDLAIALATNKATISRILSGKTKLSATMAIKLALVLGRTPEYWLDIQSRHTVFEVEKTLYITDCKKL